MEETKEVLIRYEHVDIYQKEYQVLADVNFQLYEKDFLYIIGKVGSGKSSLLKTIYAELPIVDGHAHVLDYNIKRIKANEIPGLRRSLGIVFQDFQLLTDRTVEENLEFVLRATGWHSKKEILGRIEGALNQVGLYDKKKKMPHQLSGGEQQRVVIARALLNYPKIILADEPTGNLDPETASQVLKILHDISRSGTAVIMSTHNYRLLKEFPSRMMKCEENTLKKVVENEI
ncbi:MAG: ATP-binding cassette domain-containing protein [Candidatus Azobacteroides sp.]|nr:ATP-binding cassette domain-containing protein [Candidatus Azobacteroides sp.]